MKLMDKVKSYLELGLEAWTSKQALITGSSSSCLSIEIRALKGF